MRFWEDGIYRINNAPNRHLFRIPIWSILLLQLLIYYFRSLRLEGMLISSAQVLAKANRKGPAFIGSGPS